MSSWVSKVLRNGNESQFGPRLENMHVVNKTACDIREYHAHNSPAAKTSKLLNYFVSAYTEHIRRTGKEMTTAFM